MGLQTVARRVVTQSVPVFVNYVFLRTPFMFLKDCVIVVVLQYQVILIAFILA